VLLFATFPIETAAAAREAGEAASLRRVFRYAGELMDEGWCVLIFPEGALEREAEITEFRPGVGQLALKMQAPVVPVKVEGAREVMPPGKRFPRRRGKITVKFGKPMTFKTGDPAEIAKRVEDAVKSL
jgi:long-chain acyl-CoA synthetase